jgi:hyaluronate lyase
MNRVRKQGLHSIVMLIFVLALLTSYAPQQAHASDEYDTLRAKWKTMLTGGSSYSTTDTDIAAAVAAITASAQTSWNSLNKTPTETANYLWVDLRSSSDSSQLSFAWNNSYLANVYAIAI